MPRAYEPGPEVHPECAEPGIEARSSRELGYLAAGIGGLGLAGAAIWEPLRAFYPVLVFCVACAVGVWRILDRGVRLEVSDAGVRYADWGRIVVPWREFSGYRWCRWQGNPHLQLVPRRPSDLLAGFSFFGRLNCRAARLVRMPAFAIATTPLDVGEAELEEVVARHLPPSSGA